MDWAKAKPRSNIVSSGRVTSSQAHNHGGVCREHLAVCTLAGAGAT
jgi:hypothetical protein